MSNHEEFIVSINNKLDSLAITVDGIESAQRVQTKQGKNQNLSTRLENAG